MLGSGSSSSTSHQCQTLIFDHFPPLTPTLSDLNSNQFFFSNSSSLSSTAFHDFACISNNLQASSDPMAPLPCTDFAAFAPVPRRSPSPSASFPPSASFTTLCAAEVAPPPDYITVPPLLTTLDAALPPEPSPLVQLPFQVPLVSVELFHRRPSLDDGTPIEPTTTTIARKDSIAALLEEKSEEREEATESGSSTTASSRVRPVRRVRFADDCGQCLETVRVMTEPSDYPPKISPAVLRRFRRAAAATAAALNGQSSTTVLPGSTTSNATAIDEEDSDELEEDGQAGGKKRRSSWKMAFKQPASEYVKFRDNLDRQKVALENVMLKNELGRMVGTIKVANVAYEKRVFVRYTADGWGSYRDSDAKWQSSPSKTFDTFRFDVELPRNEHPSSRIEFCVCFVAGSAPMEVHHWDSNDGKNFVLISPTEYPTPSPSIHFNHNNNKSALGKSPQQMVRSQPRPIERRLELGREDPYRVDWNSPNGWSSTAFGAWKQLSTDGPYWSTSPPFSPVFASEDDENNNNNEFNNIGTLLCD